MKSLQMFSRKLDQTVKFSEQRTFTNKIINDPTNLPKRKIIRISFTDDDATDSEDDDHVSHTRRVVRHVKEIRFLVGSPESKPRPATQKPQTRTQPQTRNVVKGAVKYRGVRQRLWGRFAAEIRDPVTGLRLWLGTYDTAEEAAMVYDNVAIQLRGADAQTNFINPPSPKPKPKPKPEPKQEPETTHSSPTSVLRFQTEILNPNLNPSLNPSMNLNLVEEGEMELDIMALNDFFGYGENNAPMPIFGDDYNFDLPCKDIELCDTVDVKFNGEDWIAGMSSCGTETPILFEPDDYLV